MKLATNVVLLGSTLMVFSAYGASAPASEAGETTAGQSEPVVVTAARARSEDAMISAEVRRQINERPSLRFFNIVVYAADQRVYLEGLVDTRMDRDLGEAIAGAVPGVRSVYNELAVSGG